MRDCCKQNHPICLLGMVLQRLEAKKKYELDYNTSLVQFGSFVAHTQNRDLEEGDLVTGSREMVDWD